MKTTFTKKIVWGVFVCLFVLVTASCEKDKEDELGSSETVKEYSAQMGSLATELTDFITKAQEFETANFNSKTVKEVGKIIDDYVTSGEKLVKTMEAMVEIQQKTKSYATRSGDALRSDNSCSLMDLLPDAGGISPGAAKSVGDLIGDTRNESKKLAEKYDKGEIDDVEYYESVNKLRKEKSLKAANIGVAAVVGTGTGLLAAGVATAVSAPVLVVVGVGALAGAAAGWGVSYFASWYSKTKAEGEEHLITGTTTVGGEIPLHLIPEGANLTIAINGYAPVTIPNVKHPNAGMVREIVLNDPPKLSEVKVGMRCEVCYQDRMMTGSDCDAIKFISGSPHPLDPAPFQSVTVTASVIPVVVGCDIKFHIIGTDGYSKSETKTTDSNGEATFYIPGGEEDVYDRVTITSSNGKTYTVSYTF